MSSLEELSYHSSVALLLCRGRCVPGRCVKGEFAACIFSFPQCLLVGHSPSARWGESPKYIGIPNPHLGTGISISQYKQHPRRTEELLQFAGNNIPPLPEAYSALQDSTITFYGWVSQALDISCVEKWMWKWQLINESSVLGLDDL